MEKIARRIATFITAVALCSCVTIHNHGGTSLAPPDVLERALSSAVIVKTYSHDNPIANGSGFVIAEDGLIVTNFHVIYGCLKYGEPKITVEFQNGRKYTVVETASYPSLDIAILKINAKGLPVLKIAEEEPSIGERVYSIGTTWIATFNLSQGVIGHLSRIPGIPLKFKWFQTTATIYGGFSGGPTINIYGELIGINDAVYTFVDSFGLVIPARYLKGILSKKIVWDEDPAVIIEGLDPDLRAWLD